MVKDVSSWLDFLGVSLVPWSLSGFCINTIPNNNVK